MVQLGFACGLKHLFARPLRLRLDYLKDILASHPAAKHYPPHHSLAGFCYTKAMQKIATRVFVYASMVFGVLGIIVVLTQPDDDSILSRLLLCTVFVILPSFALSVAGKYLNGKH